MGCLRKKHWGKIQSLPYFQENRSSCQNLNSARRVLPCMFSVTSLLPRTLPGSWSAITWRKLMKKMKSISTAYCLENIIFLAQHKSPMMSFTASVRVIKHVIPNLDISVFHRVHEVLRNEKHMMIRTATYIALTMKTEERQVDSVLLLKPPINICVRLPCSMAKMHTQSFFPSVEQKKHEQNRCLSHWVNSP